MILSLMTSVLLVATNPANTTDEMDEATARLTNWCATAVEDSIDRTVACACGTGILSERLSDREFILMAGLTHYVGDEAAMKEAVTRLIEEEGISAGFIRNAARKNANAAGRADRICSVLERPAEQWQMMAEINGAKEGFQPASLPRPEQTDISMLIRSLGNEVFVTTDSMVPAED